MNKPLLYIVLGSPRCGRVSVVCDLIARGTSESDSVGLIVPDSCRSEEVVGFCKQHERVERLTWSWNDDGGIDVHGDFKQMQSLFLLTQGDVSPVDQMEALVNWVYSENAVDVGRVLMILDCELASRELKLMPWFEACIHFSDVVLLNNRDNVSPAWMKSFIDKFQKEECYPCLFEYVKRGRLDHPEIVLLPEARRISQIFDERDVIYELEFDENNLPEGPFDLNPHSAG